MELLRRAEVAATIYLVDDSGIHPVTYDETEHVRLTRDFLVDRDRFLKHLLQG